MADLFEREILEEASSLLFQPQSQQTHFRLSSLKTALFQVFYQYYETSETRHMHSSSAAILASTLLARGVVLLQLLGLMALSLTNRQQWDAFNWFLQAFAYTRFDQIAASLGMLRLFYYCTSALVGAVCLTLCFMVIRAYHNLPPDKFFARAFFSAATNYLRGAGLVPSLSVLAAASKYSAITKDKMPEYWDTDAVEMNLGAGGVVAGVFAFLGCLVVLLHISMVYEQFQTSAQWNLRAKAHALADLVVHIAIFMIVAVLFVVDEFLGVKVAAIAVCIPAALASGMSLYYIPYYRLQQNLLWPALLNILILAAVALFISHVEDSPGVTVAIVLFASPVVIRLTKEIMQMRWDFAASHYCKDFAGLQSHFHIELGTRVIVQRVIDGDKSAVKNVVAAFNVCTVKAQAKMTYVWETNFYLSVLQDPRVAMIKLTKSQLSSNNFEADFRVFCCQKEIEEEHKRYEELEYLTFWYAFEEAKALDRESCHLLGAFWSELSASIPRYISLSRLVTQIAHTLRKCIEKSKSALKNYRTSKQALNLLGTLLKEILNDNTGDEYILKANLVQESLEKKYFSEEGAMIVVSGKYSSLGEILFISEKAKSVLNIKNESEVIGLDISIFIPEPWAKSHNGYLKRFLLCSTTNSVGHSVLHLVGADGYLVVVSAQIRVSCLHGNAFILVAFMESEKMRQALLLSGDRVLSFSKEVPALSGLPSPQSGVSLDELFPGLVTWLKKFKPGDKFVFFSQRTRARMRLKLVEDDYCGQKVRTLYLLSDAECKSSASLVQYSLSQVTLDPQTPTSLKKVGFDSLSSVQDLQLPMKGPTYQDLDDPAFASKPQDGEVKVSINSSVASSNFLASSPYSRDDLRRVRASSFRLKASLLFMVSRRQMCCMVAISGVSCGLVATAAEEEFLADDFQLLLRRGYYSARIATKARQIQRSGNTTAAIAHLTDDIQRYLEIFSAMKDSVGKWKGGPALKFYYENRVTTWEFWNEKVTMHKRNLLDAIQIFLDNAQRISIGRPRTSDFFYVIRNGLGETFKVLNETIHLHAETNQKELHQSQLIVTVTIWCGEAAMLILYITMVLPSVVLIAQVHAQAWRRLLSLSRGTLLKLRNECHTRLEFHHNRDEHISQPFEPQTKEYRMTSFRCKWSGLTVKTFAYILLSSLFLVLLWQLLCVPVFELLIASPHALAELEEQNELLQTILFWVSAT